MPHAEPYFRADLLEARRHLVSGTWGAAASVNREATGGRRPRPGGQRARGRRASRSGVRRARPAGPTAASHGPRERQGSRGSGGAGLGGEARRAPASLHGPRPSHHPLARSPPRSPRPSLGPQLGVWPGGAGWPMRPRLPSVPGYTRGVGACRPPAMKFGGKGSRDGGGYSPPRVGTRPSSRAWGWGSAVKWTRRVGTAGSGRWGRLAPERARAARDRARAGARGGWGAMAWSNPPRLFLAPALGDAKCQVPGVPAGPRRGRAGRRRLKGSETCFPRGDGPGAQEVPSTARRVSGLGGPRSAHPRSGHCLSGPYPTPVPRTGSRRRLEGQLVTATTTPA